MSLKKGHGHQPLEIWYWFISYQTVCLSAFWFSFINSDVRQSCNIWQLKLPWREYKVITTENKNSLFFKNIILYEKHPQSQQVCFSGELLSRPSNNHCLNYISFTFISINLCYSSIHIPAHSNNFYFHLTTWRRQI